MLSDLKISSCSRLVESNARLQVPSMEIEDDFWDILHDFQNAILADEDLFISTPSDFAIGQNNKRKIDESQEDSIFSTDRKSRFRHVQVEDEPAYDLSKCVHRHFTLSNSISLLYSSKNTKRCCRIYSKY